MKKIILIIFAIGTSIFPQNSENFIIKDSWNEGACLAVESFGNFLIYAHGGYVDVLEDPYPPNGLNKLSESSHAIKIDGLINELEYFNNKLFVGAGEHGVFIYRLKNNEPLELLSEIKFNTKVEGIKAFENYCYIAAGEGGLFIYDVKDASRPKLLGHYDTEGYAMDIETNGVTAYVSDYYGLSIIDVWDKTNPVQLSYYKNEHLILDSELLGQKLFVANYYNGVLYFDVSDATNIKLLDKEQTMGLVNHVTVFTGKVFATEESSRLVSIYFSSTELSDAAVFELESPAFDAIVHNWKLYIANSETGLIAFQLNDSFWPQNLQELSGGQSLYAVDDFDNYEVQDFFINGDKVFAVAERGGLYVIDDIASSFVSNYADGQYYRNVFANGKYLFVSSQEEELKVFDYSDPANLKLVSKFDSTFIVQDLYVQGSYVYLSSGGNGLIVLDISDPQNPRMVSHLSSGDYSSDIEIDGTILYLVDGIAGIKKIDISDPANPLVIGSINNTNAEKVTIDEYSFLISSGLDGVIMEYPLEGTTISDGNVTDAGMYINKLFLANGNIDVFEIYSSSYRKLEEGTIHFKGHAKKLEFNDGNIFFIDSILYKIPLYSLENYIHQPHELYHASGRTLSSAILGEKLYVADQSHYLKIFDPHNLDSYPNEFIQNYDLLDVREYFSEYLFVTDDHDIVNIFKPITNYPYLQLVNDFYEPGLLDYEIASLLVSDMFLRFALVGNMNNEVHLYNLSDIQNIYKVSSSNTSQGVISIAAGPDYFAVAEQFFGVELFKVDSTYQLYEYATWAEGSSPYLIKIQNDIALIANEGRGIDIYLVADPLNPVLISTIETSNLITSMNIIGDNIYYGESGGGLKMTSLSDDPNNMKHGYFDIGVNVEHISPGPSLSQDEILVSFGDAGLYLLNYDETTSVSESSQMTPSEFKLKQNYPNPFNPVTNIEYDLPEISFVSLTVFDLLGREIATLVNERQQKGSHKVKFDARNLPSGVYIYRIKAGNFSSSRKFVLLK